MTQQMNSPLPMSVITGYLGAGKTTFVNTLLQNAEGKRITVLVNDFGEISLDETLIENQDGDVIALANGCMCCQIGGDLYRTIDRILRLRNKIDHLVVETSGVADPSKISQIAIAEPELLNNGVVTLIDAWNYLELNQDPMLQDTLERQIRNADLILLSKHELANKKSIAETLLSAGQISQDAPVCYSSNDAFNWLFEQTRITVSTSSQPIIPGHSHHKVPFDSWSWRGDALIPIEPFFDLLKDESLAIYRCKGVLAFDDGSHLIVNKVGERIKTQVYDGAARESSITVIGKTPDFNRSSFENTWNNRILNSDG